MSFLSERTLAWRSVDQQQIITLLCGTKTVDRTAENRKPFVHTLLAFFKKQECRVFLWTVHCAGHRIKEQGNRGIFQLQHLAPHPSAQAGSVYALGRALCGLRGASELLFVHFQNILSLGRTPAANRSFQSRPAPEEGERQAVTVTDTCPLSGALRELR